MPVRWMSDMGEAVGRKTRAEEQLDTDVIVGVELSIFTPQTPGKNLSDGNLKKRGGVDKNFTF